MTSGHLTSPTDGRWQIKVIPACLNGTSVFGPGMVSYVRGFWSWNSDSGSDIKICQLYDPIGAPLGYFGYTYFQSRWQDRDYWTMAGYPYDVSLVSMSREAAIAVRDDDDGDNINVNGTTYDTTQVESDGDEASGVSGAPLCGRKGPTPLVCTMAWNATARSQVSRFCRVQPEATGLSPRHTGVEACGADGHGTDQTGTCEFSTCSSEPDFGSPGVGATCRHLSRTRFRVRPTAVR